MKRFLGAAAFSLLCVCGQTKELPTVDPGQVIARHGKPDRIKSTEFDKPRPPFVTKIFEYKKQNVKIVFLANAPIGS
ncbi:hypothetical protein, partial [Polaromonas sp. P5_E6]